jgi:hypothetical protein
VSPAQAPVGQALELIRPPAGVALTDDERHWNQLVREARVMASTAMVPRAMRGKPEVVLSAFMVCEAYGADHRLAVNKVHYMNDELVPSAELRAGVAQRAGYQLSWEPRDGGYLGDDRATLAIRRPGEPWSHFTVTVDQAVRFRKFDEWVENWPEGGRKSVWILRRNGEPYPHDDVDQPDWVAKEVAGGRVKRFDGWWDFTEDMLASAAIRKAIRRKAPQVLLGMESVGIDRAFDLEADELPDDDTVDAELVDDDSGGPMTPEAAAPGRSRTPPTGLGRDRLASPVERRALHATIAALDPAGQARLRQLKNEAGIPPIDGGEFTTVHAEGLLDLIEQLGGSPADGGPAPTVGAVDGEGGDPLRPSPSASTKPLWQPGEEPFD